MRRLVRFRSVPEDLRPPLDTWDPSFVELGKDAAPFDKRFLELPPSDSGGSNVIAPKARFRGRVAVLISATNSSATFGFAQRIKDGRLATLVGETTGGNRRGINGGAYFFARLPDSGIEFDIPLIGTFPDAPRPDAGIEPDVRVPVTAAAIAAGRDEALDRALALVGRAS
jgi:C-terminal processing protease CtpA/Prc